MTGHHVALADARPHCFWLDRPELVPDNQPRLVGDHRADLAIVGGGYTGLWTALLAKERDPSRDVILLEGNYVGWAASGRNGGFCAANLTHGLSNGAQRWPHELQTLERLGRQNLDEIEKAVHRYGIDCDFNRAGAMGVATEAYQVEGLEEHAALVRQYGNDAIVLDRDQAQAELRSPTYLGAIWMTDSVAMLDPAKLAWGLRAACLEAGVRIHEHTPVERIDDDNSSVRLRTPFGSVTAEKAVLATNAFPPLLRRIRQYVVPVYDYALMTEPLSAEQRDSIGWEHNQGVDDLGNQFHYYRPTADGRILWGGYDAIYHYGNRIQPGLSQRPGTFSKLAAHFFATFPQLEGIRFTHSWGGVIDTCSRFSVFFGTASRGRIAYAVGYTGLGVGATRFGGQVVLDLLAGERTERTELDFVRTKPVPFPPEPLRSGVINLTRWSYARADQNEGRPNLWLKTLDRLGLGFQS